MKEWKFLLLPAVVSLLTFGVVYLNHRYVLGVRETNPLHYAAPLLTAFAFGVLVTLLLKFYLLLKEKERKLKELALTDELTGLPNRRALMEMLELEIERARRHRRPLSFALLDLDDFKQINDTYGHLVGDRVLRELAFLIRRNLRSTDVVGRFGGEEFMIIMPETDFNRAVYIMERIRRSTEQTFFDPVGSLSISIGVTEFREEDTLQTLIARADEHLYTAKREGKNRVVAG